MIKKLTLCLGLFACLSLASATQKEKEVGSVYYYKGTIGQQSAQLNFELNESELEGSCFVMGEAQLMHLKGRLNENKKSLILLVFDDSQNQIGHLVLGIISTEEEYGVQLSGILKYTNGKELIVKLEKVAEVSA